jgi:hypothetical protein
MTHGDIAGARSDSATESRHEAFLLRACPERLQFVCIERAEPRKQLVGRCQVMIDASAELIDIAGRPFL